MLLKLIGSGAEQQEPQVRSALWLDCCVMGQYKTLLRGSA